jgi:hypothetical protein
MNKLFLRSVFCFLLSALLLLPCLAAVPGQMNYQGILKDGSGNLLTGSYAMVFTIYDSASGGTSLWTETQTVSVEAGLYNIQLGSSTALSSSVFNGSTRYLGVKVGSDSEMTPRVVLVSVPYAFRASIADQVSGLSGSYVNFGTDEVQATDERYGLYVKANRTAGAAVRYGVYGATTGEGFTAGVFGFQNSGSSGAGVYGYSPTAFAVLADTDSGTAVYANSDTGTGVTASGASGGSFTSTGTNTNALYANANAVSGTNYGLYAIALSPDGYGVYGEANDATASGTSYGVYGYNNSGGGASNHGVYGITFAPGSAGVYGKNGNNNGIAVTVDDVLYLKPRAAAPTGSAEVEGAMYYDSTLHSLRYYNGTSWYDL